jgi:hypothetical protein
MNAAELVFATVDFSAIDTLRTQGAVLNHRDWPEQITPCPVVPLA